MREILSYLNLGGDLKVAFMVSEISIISGGLVEVLFFFYLVEFLISLKRYRRFSLKGLVRTSFVFLGENKSAFNLADLSLLGTLKLKYACGEFY